MDVGRSPSLHRWVPIASQDMNPTLSATSKKYDPHDQAQEEHHEVEVANPASNLRHLRVATPPPLRVSKLKLSSPLQSRGTPHSAEDLFYLRKL